MIKQSGQTLPIVIIVVGVVLISTLVIIGGAQLYFSSSNYSIEAERATALAEAGVDKAVIALNKSAGSYNGEGLGDFGTAIGQSGEGEYSVKITAKDASTKIIEATGYLPNKVSAKVKRKVTISATKGVGAAFNYGIQVGDGGMDLGNFNIVNGSVYSNGSITAGQGNQIKGDVYVAGGPQPNPDQLADCDGVNCSTTEFTFGKKVNGEDRMDVAQSFKPSSSGALNKVSVKVKKFGNPPDATVRILLDNGGKPDKNGVLTTGTLYSNLVTTNSSFIDVTFATLPALTIDATYWLMVSSVSLDNNNYWIWQNDLASSYNRGIPGWSPKWNHGSPTWNNITGDLGFKTYLGGAPTVVMSGHNSMTVTGDVHANTIQNLIISKDAYYQTIVNTTVSGVSHPGSADPAPKVFPISDANVLDWKDLADGTVSTPTITNGDITTCPATLGPRKIVGNVTLNSGCNITLKSPIWITGNLALNSNNNITLDANFHQATSGVIVVDGTVSLNSFNHLNGTGIGSSLLMVLSNYDSTVDGINAIAVNSNGNTGVYYASRGIVSPGTGNSFKELTAWKIKLINSSTIDYEQGLSSTLFSSGPSGSYTLVKGTYQVR